MATNMPRESKKRKRQLLFCGHCKRSLPHATFYRHRERYYDESSGSWSQLYSADDESTSEPEFYQVDLTVPSIGKSYGCDAACI